MPTPKFTPEARKDLKQIGQFIGRVSKRPMTADRVIDALKAKREHYSQFPTAAQAAPELGPNLRLGVHQRWVIIYEPIDNGIRVLTQVTEFGIGKSFSGGVFFWLSPGF